MCVGRKYIDRPNEIRSRLSSALYGVICPIFRTRSLSLSLYFFKKQRHGQINIYIDPTSSERERERNNFFSLFLFWPRGKRFNHTEEGCLS